MPGANRSPPRSTWPRRRASRRRHAPSEKVAPNPEEYGGSLSLSETYSRVGAIRAPGQRWLYSGSNTQSYTFNTPTAAQEKDQCGRVYYSSFHIGSGRSSTGTFPGACKSTPLTPQERVLEFMLFDLASCVQSDKKPPVVPK